MNIAVLGCGTVAGGVIRLLRENRDEIARQAGEEIRISRVLARHPEKARALGFADEAICTDIDRILGDESIAVVVELIGGVEDAYRFVKGALTAGKHVVTANKDLIALHLRELSRLASEKGVSLFFEGAVGGGIPLIAPLRRTLAANRITDIYGILNGTTNYILSRMTKENIPYAEALSAAQALGYAEADPSADVLGDDSARKIAILASLAFHTEITYPEVRRDGITKVTGSDIRFAARLGMVPKLLAACHRTEAGVEAYVRPFLVPLTHPLSAVGGPFNAVYLNGEPVGEVMLYGQGAGADPTASSVVGDIMELKSRLDTASYEDCCETALPVLEHSARRHTFYLNLLVADKPKVLAGIALALGECGVSIASLVQEQTKDGTAEIMLTTHQTAEADFDRACEALRDNASVLDLHSMMILPEKA